MTTVQDLYREILGREAEASGLQHWQSTFGADISPEEIAQFKTAAAPELAARGASPIVSSAPASAPAPAPMTVADLYQTVLGRAPDEPGLQHWQSRFGTEVSPEEAAQFKVAAEPELTGNPLISQYWAWNDPRYAAKDTPGQYGLQEYWDVILQKRGFDLSKKYIQPMETVVVPVYDANENQIGTKTVTRPQTTMDDQGNIQPVLNLNPEYRAAIDYLRNVLGIDVRQRNPDADTYNTYYGIIGPGGKVLQDIKIKGGNASGWDSFGQALLDFAPMVLPLVAGPLAGWLGGGVLGAAGSGAILGGVNAAARGGDVLKGALIGGATGGLGGLAAPYINELGGIVSEAVGGDTLGKLASGAVTGAAKSGLGALISDRDIPRALLSGAVSGAGGSALNLATGEARGFLSDLPKPVQDAVISAGIAALKGGNTDAVIRAGFNSLLKGAAGSAKAKPSDVVAEGEEGIFGDAGTGETVGVDQSASVGDAAGFIGEDGFRYSGVPEWDDALDAATKVQFTQPDTTTTDAPQVIDVTGKRDVIIPDWDRLDVINPDWDILPLPLEEPDRTPGSPEDTSPGGGTTGREDEVTAPAPSPAPALAPSPAPAPRPAPTPTPAPQTDSGIAGITPQQWAVLNAILAGKMGAGYDPYLLGKAARERREKEESLNELMAALGFNQQA